MGFNSGFKGLIRPLLRTLLIVWGLHDVSETGFASVAKQEEEESHCVWSFRKSNFTN